MIKLPYSLKIAINFNKSKKKTNFVSLISTISIFSIALGVSVLIISLSVMNGFKYELKNSILSVVPHGQIISINQPYFNWKIDLKKIKNISDIVAVSPYINFVGLIEKNNILKEIQIVGIDLPSENTVNLLFNSILYNAYKKLKPGNNEIILGQGIAKILKVSPGNNITIIVANYSNKLHNYQLNKINVTIIEVLKLNNILDYNLAIIPLQDAQQYLSYNNGITGFNIKAKDIFNVNDILYNAKINIGHNVIIKSWIEDYGYIYHDIQTIRSIMYITMILVISIACFNIISTLILTIKDKKIDIAILKTLGAKDSFIHIIFMWYGLLTGIIGYFIGILIGIFISLNLTIIIKYIGNIIGHSILYDKIYFINFLPSKIYFTDIFYIILTTLILSLLSSWYPAKRAIKIDPVQILSKK
ncbi:MAG: lipoprotein-releasing ABC transporter permease subunit LolE [Arsenophonus endosymbiont of Ceratovacuna japonica]